MKDETRVQYELLLKEGNPWEKGQVEKFFALFFSDLGFDKLPKWQRERLIDYAINSNPFGTLEGVYWSLSDLRNILIK